MNVIVRINAALSAVLIVAAITGIFPGWLAAFMVAALIVSPFAAVMARARRDAERVMRNGR